jgi:transposase
MPKHVKARAAQDEQEERLVRKLANSHHAPADWKWHAQMVLLSWAGKTPNEIAAELDCHPQTVRIHLGRFTAEGVAGLLVRSGSGRKPRLTEQERSRILALVKQAPPGHLETQADGTMVARDEEGSAQWTLNALAQAAKEAGIRVKRSQIRRISQREGVRWRRTHSWGDSSDPAFVRNRAGGRLPLHPTTRGVDDRLHRRARASSSPHLPTSACLVYQRPSHQSAAG